MSNFITIKKFSELYEVSLDNIYVHTSLNKDAEYIMKDKEVIFYDLDYFERRQEERSIIWNQAHDYYYYIKEELNINDSEFARLVGEEYPTHSWVQYMGQGLWRRVDNTPVLSEQSYDMLYKFHAWCKKYTEGM